MVNRARKKYASLDVAKFCCAVILLLYHYFSEYGSLPSILEDALSSYAVCVALFMVISGFLLYDKLFTVDSKEEKWRIVKRQVVRIYQIYLLWSVPYIIYSISRWDPSELSFSFLFWNIQGWIFRSTFFTIWFMPSLAIGILISYFVVEKFSDSIIILLSLLAYAIGSLDQTYSFVIDKWSGYSDFHSFVDLWLNGPRGQFFYGFPLVTAGYFIAKNKKSCFDIKKTVSYALLTTISTLGLIGEAVVLRKYIGHAGADMAIFMIPTVMSTTCFLIYFPLSWNDNYVFFRNMSVLIFVSQRLFLTVLPNISDRIKYLCQNQITSFILVCIGDMLFSFAVILMSKKIKSLKRLY